MDNFDQHLVQALRHEQDYDDNRSDSVQKEVVQMFHNKKRFAAILTWIWLVIAPIVILSLIWYFFQTTNIKAMLLCVMIVLIIHESTVLMKLWYWAIDTKTSVLKEIKQLQLQIGELTQADRNDDKS